MKSFKTFLEAAVTPYQRPTESLGIYEIEKLLNGPCSDAWDAYQNGLRLYRGTWTEHKMNVYDPSTGTRRSENTSNYYTLFFDTNPANQGWPKRSKSFVCTTNEDVAGDYGRIHCIFPFNGVKLAVCPDSDIWDSGYYPDYYPGVPHLIRYDALNGLVEAVMPDVKTYQEFVDTLLNFEKDEFVDLLKNTNVHRVDFEADFADSLSKMDDSEFRNFLHGWIDAYTFSKGDFELVDGMHYVAKNREVWFSGKCLIIPARFMKYIVDHMDFQD